MDADLRDIRESLAGDGRAFERLVRRYEAQVARQMWRFSRDPAVCEELAQDVFVEVYFSLGRFRGKAPFLHWIRRIATRVGYRFWKRRAKEDAHASLKEWGGVASREQGPDPARAAGILHALLSRLPPADRLVMTLMYLEECGTREIAERTGWTRPMVKMRAYRARKKLREIAEQEDVLEGLFDGQA